MPFRIIVYTSYNLLQWSMQFFSGPIDGSL